ARRLCPQGVFLPVRMNYYAQISRQLRQILLSFTPLVEPISLDEAFLDVHGCEGLFGPAPEVARQIKARIRAETEPPAPACVGALGGGGAEQVGGEACQRPAQARRPVHQRAASGARGSRSAAREPALGCRQERGEATLRAGPAPHWADLGSARTGADGSFWQ